MLFNVAIRREGGIVAACDGPDCKVCAYVLREAAASLSPQPAPWQPIETLRADALYEALRSLNDGLPQVDNGYCAICKVGYRSYDTHGRPLYNCSNEECVSHKVYRALLMRTVELAAPLPQPAPSQGEQEKL